MSESINAEKFELANKWLRLHNKNISILQSFKNKGISKIIIYGASEFALRLIEQFENENKLAAIIAISDKRITSKGTYYKNIPLISIDDIAGMDLDGVSVVITAMGFYEEISNELRSKKITNFISLKELIYDIYC